MPSVVGNLLVQNSRGSFNLDDFYTVSPKDNTKGYKGASFIINTFNGLSSTNIFDANVTDQDQIRTVGSVLSFCAKQLRHISYILFLHMY